MGQKGKGIGSFSTLLIIFLVFGVYAVITMMSASQKTYSYEEFVTAVEKQQIKSVVVEQKKAVPTGTLIITLPTLTFNYLQTIELYKSR